MNKQERLIRCYEKIAKATKKSAYEQKEKRTNCAGCIYCRPDFKYRKCQFSRCIYNGDIDVFRKKPLGYDKFAMKEVVKMNG